MALALSGHIRTSIDLAQTNALVLSTPSDSISLADNRTITSGTGAEQGDLLWHDQRTLSNGATEDLALHAGTLTGPFGSAITFDKVKGIFIRNLSTVNSLKIGGATATCVPLFANTSDILVLPACASTTYPTRFLIEAPAAAGLAVTTNELLKIGHGGDTTNSQTYDIVIWGED